MKRDRQITPTQAFRAVYIDFEGFQDEPPVLLGRLKEYSFSQLVVDPEYKPVAYPSNCTYREFTEAIENTVELCHDESRVLIGFSRTEVQKIENFAGIDVRPIYRDAHKIAKRWINRVHGCVMDESAFDQFMEFLGYEKPKHFGDQKVTHRLRGVRNGLQARGTYEDLTAVQKAKWTKLLKYNRVDCLGMRDLVLRAASEISADS